MRYEEYRQALQREIERRQKQQKRLSSQALAEWNFNEIIFSCRKGSEK